jgi:flagellar basal body-associated protein FliL
MLPWIIQMSIISLIVIVLVHYLFIFFKKNLTTPIVKDLVNKPQKQYDALFNTMNQPDSSTFSSTKHTNDSIEISNATNNSNMKSELKNYLKELSDSKKSKSDSTNKGVPNINNNGGIMTGENVMTNSFDSNNYAIF